MRARNKIKHWLNEDQRRRAVEIGRKLLEREARRFKVPMSQIDDQDLARIAGEYGVATAADLLATLGAGKHSAHQVLNKLAPGYANPPDGSQTTEPQTPGTVDQAIAFGDVVFMAVPYGALPQIGRDYGKSLAGKIVLDADNAVASRDGAIADEVERNGIGVTSQKYLLGARLVRAFNTLSYMIFEREANRAAPRLAVRLADHVETEGSQPMPDTHARVGAGIS